MFSWHYSIKYLLKFSTFFLSVVRDNNSHIWWLLNVWLLNMISVNSNCAQVPEAQIQLQQKQQTEQQSQNLLGIAYSSAPSVARVKVSGNGYKFDFWSRLLQQQYSAYCNKNNFCSYNFSNTKIALKYTYRVGHLKFGI